VTTDPGFRCSAAGLERADSIAGSASTVRSFLLIELTRGLIVLVGFAVHAAHFLPASGIGLPLLLALAVSAAIGEA